MFTGRGIFATKVFLQGDFILQYRGKLETCAPDTSDTYLYEFVHDGKRMWYAFVVVKFSNS